VAARGDLDLTVLFCCDWGVESYTDPDFGRTFSWDIPLVDGYDHVFLPIEKRPEKLSFRQVDNPTVGDVLDRIRPDVVQTFGYAHRTSWRAASWARQRRIPLLIFSDSSLLFQPTGLRSIAKRAIVGRFYERVSGALAVGDNNRAYHSSYGLPQTRIFDGVMPIDRKRLAGSVSDVATTRARIRAEQGIPDDAFVVVFSGKFVDYKRPHDLVLAGALAQKTNPSVWTLFVGDGPERESLEGSISEQHITNARIAGFINQKEIAAYYAASDVVAITSEVDNHPLVVTEGAEFGLPVLVSDRVGCIGPSDTARPDVNALVYPCGDVDKLATRILELASDPPLHKRLAASSRAIAESQGTDRAADALRDAVQALRELGPRTK
jgi:glycosyltransferase involved in cell wall biosynthesis